MGIELYCRRVTVSSDIITRWKGVQIVLHMSAICTWCVFFIILEGRCQIAYRVLPFGGVEIGDWRLEMALHVGKDTRVSSA